jgi:hypothetical protein
MLMKCYMSQLEAAAEARRAKYQAEREEKARAEAEAVRVRLTPLEDRLTRLLTTIPIDVQREGLSLASLQTSLRGRSRGNCHPGELGQALRRLGFERRRNWRGTDGFRAAWHRVDRGARLTQTAEVDLKHPLRIAALDASIGRRAGVHRSPREEPVSAP